MDQLEKIADGLFVNDTTRQISVQPSEIGFWKYVMPSTLGHSEHEDIAARLVEAAVESGQWVGVSYQRLAKQYVAELEAMHSENTRKHAEMDAEWAKAHPNLKTRISNYVKSIKGVFTRAKPVTETPTQAQPEVAQLPHSVMTFLLYTQGPNGPGILGSEIRDMADKGYLQLTKHGEQDILVPTPKLIDTIYQAQQAQRRRA